ncbi:MAG TPA: hypothetical protein VIT67_05940 [Povalibacter sp.]
MSFALVRFDRNGEPEQTLSALDGELIANCRATAELYTRVGYEIPWVGYLAVVDGRGVGGGAFVGPPKDGCVEIAYYTLQNEQGRGHASKTASGLVANRAGT